MKFPGPRSKKLIREFSRYVIVDPHPFVVDIKRSSGMWLRTLDGQKLFDWSGYYASKLLGHNHPGLQEPSYLKHLALAANNKIANPDFLTPECVTYYRTLHSLAPKCMKSKKLEIYCVNSGAEAIENMMKYFINLHHQKLLDKKKIAQNKRFVYFDQAFHGRTVFALNITQISHDPMITRDFQGIIPGNIQLPFPALDMRKTDAENESTVEKILEIVEGCLKRYQDEIVGIIIEPIQGAGGHRVTSARFFQELSRLAHKYDVSLGFDEVQTAGGQCGAFFAIDLFNLPYPPQAVASAKKLGNGIVYMLYPMEDHGILDSTWGGSLADMVRFVQEWKIMCKEHYLDQVPEKTRLLLGLLHQLQEDFPDRITNIRGLGLYQGFSMVHPEDKSLLCNHALEKEGLFLLGAGTDSIRLRPPISVTEKDIRLFSNKLKSSLRSLK